jgi:hypothetical protein
MEQGGGEGVDYPVALSVGKIPVQAVCREILNRL